MKRAYVKPVLVKSKLTIQSVTAAPCISDSCA
ncbi:hypothetical protein DFR52_102386 [Hoeflea marina]|uniref:Uncharacterized protein n=1 Tax=Hoeflea marina TaxID=274592 RepID=A0A317PLB5_9HYPH|nr:hypothetical protein DFR52_102386 [Hoeflea marina]